MLIILLECKYWNNAKKINKTTIIQQIDFICRNQSEIAYIQVVDKLYDENIEVREKNPLEKLHDGKRIIINNSNINKIEKGIEYIDIKK